MDEHVRNLLEGRRMTPGGVERFHSVPSAIGLYYNTTCSLRCPYCVNNMHVGGTQDRLSALEQLGSEEYVRRIRLMTDISGKSVLHGGPGEVMESSRFRAIFRAFAEHGHYQIVQTHGGPIPRHADFYRSFGSEYMRDSVQFNISYHLGSYLTKPNGTALRERFARKIIPVLAEFGCRTQIITPLTPEVLKDKEYAAEVLGFQGLFPDGKCDIKAIELGGRYCDQRYPQSYTVAEAVRVRELMDEVGSTRPTASTPGMVRFMGPSLRLKGMPCLIRLRTIQVALDGDVFFCRKNHVGVVGSILDEGGFDLTPLLREVPCEHEVCLCKAAGYACALDPHEITPEEYYIAYWQSRYGVDLTDPDEREKAGDMAGEVER